jgi:thiamine-phosphate pyrophosphorylase
MNYPAARLAGLYAITDAGLQPGEQLEERVAQAIEGGASIIQYRDKSANKRLRLQQARALATLCDSRDVPLVINDDTRLAADCGAAGVHLGEDDSSLVSARKLLGDNAIIGISCYNRLDLAEQAIEQGADYIAFGRYFESDTKPGAIQATPDLITRSKQRWKTPVAAIGGITPNNASQLLEAGADMLAVVRGVFAAADVRQAAAAFAREFNR